MLRASLQNLKDKESELINNLAVFGINIPDNLDLRQVEKELNVLEEIWVLASRWEEAWLSYKSTTFWNIKTDEMDEFAEQLYRYANF